MAVPVPPLPGWGPSWGWSPVASALLRLSQGLSRSAAVIMEIGRVGPQRGGLAMGLDELAGHLAVALSAARA